MRTALKRAEVELRDVHAIRDGKWEHLNKVQDMRQAQTRVSDGKGGSLTMPKSPHRFHFLWFFRDDVTPFDPAGMHYEFLGWEDVDPHACMNIFIDTSYRQEGDERSRYRFWLDMSRGGHPLRQEYLRGSKLVSRTDGIELYRLTLPDGGEIWFPVRAVVQVFDWKAGEDRTPNARETFTVVPSSLRFNQGLPDKVFSVRWKGDVTDTSRLQAARHEFANNPPPPPFRTDPASVEAALARKLAEAERQAEAIEASSPARVASGGMAALRYGFGALGIALLGGAACWSWRSR